MKKPPPSSKGKKVKAWAVVMFDGFIPDFSVAHKMRDVLQIHSSKKGAQEVLEMIRSKDWCVVPCTIHYQLPKDDK